MKYYIAYGSNLVLDEMKLRCPNAVKAGASVLNDYRLEFRYYLTIVPEEGAVTPIGVFRIEDTDERNLDFYEGYPSLYCKTEVKFMLDGKEEKGLVYIMNPPWKGGVEPDTSPSKSYLERCLRGYEDFSLDSGYLTDALDRTLNTK